MSDQVTLPDQPIVGEVLDGMGPLESATVRSMAAAGLAARDEALGVLAQTVAREIDLAGDLVQLGGMLMRVLEAAQCTPKSRAVTQRGGAREQPAPDELDELADRRSRKSDPAYLDPPAAGPQ